MHLRTASQITLGIITAQKRLSHGLNFTTSYTRSKSLNNFTYSNAYNTSADYGYAANDIENLFSFGPVYELPFGKDNTGSQTMRSAM